MERYNVGIIPFLFRWIPPFIEHEGRTYQFQMFINHAHYDFRICYDCGDDDAEPSFTFLCENIASDDDLLVALRELAENLKERGFLTGDYATVEGYTVAKYEKWLKDGE